LISLRDDRSAVATFYARKDTATPCKGRADRRRRQRRPESSVDGTLAQIGLALATAVGAWVNLLLVLVFCGAKRYLAFDREWVKSLAKFAIAGIVLARHCG